MANGRTRLAILSLLLILFLAGSALLTGCRYTINRVADFRDVIQLGAGIATEDPTGGPWPPSIGLHAQVTEFVNLGAYHFHGYVAEWEGRGFYAGPETRSRLGIGPLQYIYIDQDMEWGAENYFKEADTPWAKRVAGRGTRWWNYPAKQLNWELWEDTVRWGYPVMPRGWQYWENISVEAAISEPFLTHLGICLRAGLDVSEVADFALGLFCIDFKRDDLTKKEFCTAIEESCWAPLWPGISTERKPPSSENAPVLDKDSERPAEKTEPAINPNDKKNSDVVEKDKKPIKK